ncbi:MAG: hypothetical protein HY368_02670 [Candidatus Aenigmarchaeota archaeon]|nr:hypothetical protein [Candidatus Aenigmarchaeota archaeon]
MAAVISAEKKKEMLPFIKNNFGKLSQRKIARKLGVGKTAINRWSLELGFKYRKHTVNENFFDI